MYDYRFQLFVFILSPRVNIHLKHVIIHRGISAAVQPLLTILGKTTTVLVRLGYLGKVWLFVRRYRSVAKLDAAY